MRFDVPKILANVSGYRALARLPLLTRMVKENHLVLDFSSCEWFDANMCAPLGVLLARFRQDGGTVQVSGLSPRFRPVLERNGFSQFIGLAGGASDGYNTAISFHHFGATADDDFKTYLINEFRGKTLPEMTDALSRRFRESLFELFDNAVTHAHSSAGITACGQFFPSRNVLRFTIADGGIGFAGSLRDRLGIQKTDPDAIAWAMTGTNTTKKRVPGGLGLKDIVLRLIELNRGTLRIVSGGGYWENGAGRVHSGPLQNAFPGTAVDIEINTADTQSYRLSYEMDPASIF